MEIDVCSRTYADHFAVLYMCVFTFIYSQQVTSELKGPQLKARVNDTDSKPTVRFRFVRPLLMGVRSILNIIIYKYSKYRIIHPYCTSEVRDLSRL